MWKILLILKELNLLNNNTNEIKYIHIKLNELISVHAESGSRQVRKHCFVFVFLEKQQAIKSNIGQPMIDGIVTEDQKNIGKFCEKFYSEFYMSTFCSF